MNRRKLERAPGVCFSGGFRARLGQFAIVAGPNHSPEAELAEEGSTSTGGLEDWQVRTTTMATNAATAIAKTRPGFEVVTNWIAERIFLISCRYQVEKPGMLQRVDQDDKKVARREQIALAVGGTLNDKPRGRLPGGGNDATPIRERLGVEAFTHPHRPRAGAIAHLVPGLASERDVKDKRIGALETKHFLQRHGEGAVIGHRAWLGQSYIAHQRRMLLAKGFKVTRPVEQAEQLFRCRGRCGRPSDLRDDGAEVHREHGLAALRQEENIRAVIEPDVQVRAGPGGERAERDRGAGLGQLKLAGDASVGGQPPRRRSFEWGAENSRW